MVLPSRYDSTQGYEMSRAICDSLGHGMCQSVYLSRDIDVRQWISTLGCGCLSLLVFPWHVCWYCFKLLNCSFYVPEPEIMRLAFVGMFPHDVYTYVS